MAANIRIIAAPEGSDRIPGNDAEEPAAAKARRTLYMRRYVAASPMSARGSMFRGRGGDIPRDVDLPDPTSPTGVRRTNILAVTHPHDCSKHLPGGDENVVLRNREYRREEAIAA
jgi:hypothetical protein